MTRAHYPSLTDRLVVITGGGSGIGAGLTEGFARQGAQVVFLDIETEASEALAAGLSDTPCPPEFHACDLTDLDSLQTVLDAIQARHGAVDVLINNAANDTRHSVEDVTPEYWDDRIAVNLRHKFFASRAVIDGMRKQGRGVILNMGSVSWHLGMADLPVYQTAKAGIEGMTRAMARDFGPDGIRVCCIVPGNVKTPRQDKWYSPEAEAELVAQQCLPIRIEPADILALALFLASDDARACTGHEYFVDAGWR